MKKRTILNLSLIVFISASIISCASQKNDTSKDEAAKNDKMDVTLNVTLTSNYCGGAAPSDEMIAKLKEPKKFSNKSFYISNVGGLQEGMKEVKTSTAGIVSTSLTKGTYFIFLPEKMTAKHSGKDRSESDCKKWKNTPNGTFTISDDNSISFNIHKTCDGCGALRM